MVGMVNVGGGLFVAVEEAVELGAADFSERGGGGDFVFGGFEKFFGIDFIEIIGELVAINFIFFPVKRDIIFKRVVAGQDGAFKEIERKLIFLTEHHSPLDVVFQFTDISMVGFILK